MIFTNQIKNRVFYKRPIIYHLFKSVFFLTLFLPFQLPAQQLSYNFINYTVDNGLVNNEVNCIYIDKMNFAWIATSGGLQRFDGQTFTTFSHSPDDSTTIIDDFITSLSGDENNNLWIGTNGLGLEFYNRRKQSFARSVDIEKLNSSTKYISKRKGVVVDNYGSIWYECYKGLMKFNPTSCETDTVVKGSKLIIKSGDNLFTTKNNQLLKVQISNQNTIIYPVNEYVGGNGAPKINDICNDSFGNIWIGREDGIFVYDSLTEKIFSLKKFLNKNHNISLQNFASIKKNVSFLYEDVDGNIWFASGKELFRLNIKIAQISKFTNQPYNPYSIQGETISGIYGNKKGVLWIAYDVKGFSVLNIKPQKIFNYTHIPNNENSISGKTIRAVYRTKEDLWVAAYTKGLDRYSYKENKYYHYYHDPNQETSLPSNYVSTIFIDSYNRMWIGTMDDKICYCDNINEKELSFNKLDISKVRAIREDNYGNMWFGTANGLYKYQRDNQSVSKYGFKENQLNTIEFLSISALEIQAPNIFWMSSWNNGLCKLELYSDSLLNPQTKKDVIICYSNNPKDKKSIPDNRVISLLVDKKGTKWLGTFNKGLIKMTGNDENVKFEIINKSMGASNNTIFGILEDEGGYIWCSTNNGLFKFDPEHKTFTNYNKRDGFLSNAFYWGAFHNSYDGELFFGGIEGLNSFHPNDLKPKEDSLTVYINNFIYYNQQVRVGELVNGYELLKEDLKFSEQLTISRRENMFSFEFISIDYSGTDNIKYAYKLEGFNEKWIYTDSNNRLATFSNLSAGEYIFKVKATNGNDFSNCKITQLKLIVLPYWWETWWFKAFLSIFIFGSGVLFYKIRIHQMKQRQKKLEKQVVSRTFELSNAYEQLSEKQNQLQEQNIELEANKEELMVSNDDLFNANEKLSQQKEELKATLEELKDTQMQLVQAEKMASVGTLSAGIAHEINNPLNFIQSGKYALEKYIERNHIEHTEALSRMIDVIDKGILRATTIVKSLNHFNRRSENYNEKCNINSIIDNCLIMLSTQLKNNIEVKKQYTNQKYELYGNEGELHQVMLNVLMNSIQAITENGEIHIQTDVEDTQFTIAITDTGHGIDEVNLQKVMDPFFTTKPPGKGVGLGMSISYKIIKKHNGSISYKSEVNQGTTVNIELKL